METALCVTIMPKGGLKSENLIHDANGNVLSEGGSVVLMKDLRIMGTSMTLV